MTALILLLGKLLLGLFLATKLVIVALAGVFVASFGKVFGGRWRQRAKSGEPPVGGPSFERQAVAGASLGGTLGRPDAVPRTRAKTRS